MTTIHSQILEYIDAKQVFDIVANNLGIIFLDGNSNHEHYSQYSYILINPIEQYIADHKINLSEQITIWKNILQQNQQNTPDLPPFQGGIAGYFSYDLAREIEYLPTQKTLHVPHYHLGLYNQVIAFDHIKKQCHAYVCEVDGFKLNYTQQLQALIHIHEQAIIQHKQNLTTTNPDHHSIKDKTVKKQLSIKSNFTQNEYIVAVKKAIDYIKNGDIFEVNLSQCFSGNLPTDYPLNKLYTKLREINPAPFSCFLNLGDVKILSSSPERFISIRNRQIEACPIKGTIKRASDTIIDKQLAHELYNSAKNQAENIMIVDLMRSDLSKICLANSVNVASLCQIETFTNVHHLVSRITGTLKPNIHSLDIINAAFPGGSITGAPKIRAMQIIDELEPISRGIYCGSIGYFSFNGDVDLSISIRTLVAKNQQLSFHVGGAITLDSNAEEEYQESLLKGQKLYEAITANL